MRLAFALLPISLLAQTGAITGEWVAQSKTSGVTRVVVRTEGGRTIVHSWGSCVPVDCDHGETDIDLWNGIPIAIFKAGFSTRRMQLVPIPDGRLIVAVESEYHDGSGRRDPGHAEFFVRQEAAKEGADAIAARALLRQTAETYRHLPAAYFEAVTESTRSSGRSEVRSQSHQKIWTAPPNRMRVEIDGREPLVTIADGESEWRVYPASNEYLLQPQAKNSPTNSPFYQFALLDSVRGDPRIVGHEKREGVDCTLVRIAMDHGVSQQLWIDDATHLVRRALFDQGNSRSDIVYPVARLNQTAAPELFRYDPAATGAKNRREVSKAAPESMTGKLAPDFTLRDLTGREVRLSSLRGKPVLLDFWATWCGYCREALPSIELLHRGLKDKVAVFGVDNEAPEIARDYLQKLGYTLPTLIDPKDTAVNAFHLDGWPTTVLIDAEGKIVFYEVGFEAEKLRDALRKVGVW
jgi:thiol-disulfide isomerase/thioredoxin/outer membrane lipoprotein-sorting protein